MRSDRLDPSEVSLRHLQGALGEPVLSVVPQACRDLGPGEVHTEVRSTFQESLTLCASPISPDHAASLAHWHGTRSLADPVNPRLRGTVAEGSEISDRRRRSVPCEEPQSVLLDRCGGLEQGCRTRDPVPARSGCPQWSVSVPDVGTGLRASVTFSLTFKRGAGTRVREFRSGSQQCVLEGGCDEVAVAARRPATAYDEEVVHLL